jgi:ubiquinone/menaquinone biosynthesis C-methylase UbiE
MPEPDARFWGDDADPTDYFTGCAAGYDLYREGYPDAAMAALLDGLPRPARVADVGSGTGLAARQLAALGADVVGVEPNGDMRRRAERHGAPEAGSLRYVAGTAEATGLPDSALDLVSCSQSFQWFRPRPALAEFHRILRPGGRLAVFWKAIREDNQILDAYRQVSDEARDAAKAQGRAIRFATREDLTASDLFDNHRHAAFAARHMYDREAFLGRAASASFFPSGGPLRERLLRRLEEIFDLHERDGLVEIEGRTDVYLAEAATG